MSVLEDSSSDVTNGVEIMLWDVEVQRGLSAAGSSIISYAWVPVVMVESNTSG